MPETLEDLAGLTGPKGGSIPPTSDTSLEALAGIKPKPVDRTDPMHAPSPVVDFLKESVGTAKKYETAAVEHPIDMTKSMSKAIVSGFSGFAEAVEELGGGVGSSLLGMGYEKGASAVRNVNEKVNSYIDKVAKINTKPENEQDALAADFFFMVNPLAGPTVAAADEGHLRTWQALKAVNAPEALRVSLSSAVGATIQAFPVLLGLGPKRGATALSDIKPETPESPKTPEQKVRGEHILESFKKLAKENEETARGVAEHVGKADPQLESLLKEAVETAKTKDEEVVGRDAAKAKVKYQQVGTTESGKPRVRAVPDEGVDEAASKDAWIFKHSRELMLESKKRAQTKAMLREKGIQGIEAPTRQHSTPSEMFSHTDALHKSTERMWEDFEDLANKDQEIPAVNVVRYMRARAPKGPMAELLKKLEPAVRDAKFKPTKSIAKATGFKEGTPEYEGAEEILGGAYRTDTDTVYIKMYQGGRQFFQTHVVLHELVHAATVRWAKENAKHPLVGELQTLRSVAIRRFISFQEEADREGIHLGGRIDSEHSEWDPHGSLYGLLDVFELQAEAETNPAFQDLLVRSSKFKFSYEQLKGIANALVDKILKILGITDPKEGDLLRDILNVNSKIMAESARDRLRRSQKSVEAPSAIHGMPTPEQTSAGIRDSMREGYARMKAPQPEGLFAQAFNIGNRMFERIPGAKIVKGELEQWLTWAVRAVNPEMLGQKEKVTASILSQRMWETMHDDISFGTRSEERRNFWTANEKVAPEFISWFERGGKFKDPIFQAAKEAYNAWGDMIFRKDLSKGIEYNYEENYLYHLYEPKDRDNLAAYFDRKYGKEWGDPKFMKDRKFSLYEEALKQGYKPLFNNPEDIMLARQHASSAAHMRIAVLEDLEKAGMARKKASTKERRPVGFEEEMRAPNGDWYWVNPRVHSFLKQAFETKTLWTDPGGIGKGFRGLMWLKNRIVPIRLAMSLFHPLHVQTIDNATAMVRASKDMFTGNMSPLVWFGKMLESFTYGSKGTPLRGIYDNPRVGWRIVKAFEGKIDPKELNDADMTSLKYLMEGGMLPTMSKEYQSNAKQSYRDAVLRGSAKAIFHAPFAAIQSVQELMFQKWIPSLKVASYLKDVETALRADPSLLTDDVKRGMAFRRLAKSVDNRYGEMAYSNLFMNKMLKDVAVLNTLSLGWQMGFMREYGGGMMDLAQMGKPGPLKQKIAQGQLDRPLFVLFYTTQALLYGGLITKLIGGVNPQQFEDYIYPITGKDSKGAPVRSNTMFYPREFGSIAAHMQTQGFVEGMKDIAMSKSSGVFGLIAETFTGMNSWGEEVRDPNAPYYQRVAQGVAQVLADIEPISAQALGIKTEFPFVGLAPGKTGKDVALAVLGLTPAPKYATEDPTSAQIRYTYDKYYGGKERPYRQSQLSADKKTLRAYKEAGDTMDYQKQLDKMTEKYTLTPKERKNIQSQVSGKGDPVIKMFQRLDWTQQKAILDKATPEERRKLIPHSNKEHLRGKYRPPT